MKISQERHCRSLVCRIPPRVWRWSDALSFVAERAAQTDERMVFVFDEFPYAAAAEPALPSMLQIAIDHGFLATKVTMILSGSNEGFMENDVLGRKSPLYGRRTAQIRLLPFDYADAAKFLTNTSPQELVQYYAYFRRYAILSGPYTGSRWL